MSDFDKGQVARDLLSDITVFGKYARHRNDLGRRETWTEIVDRNKAMHIAKYPQIKDIIEDVYTRSVYTKKVLPSMRSLQFAGVPIDRNPSRIYNCAFLPIEDTDSFAEIMFLLLGGTGVGYSVQKQHVAKLPIVAGFGPASRRYIIGDSIEGWADAVKVLIESYFYGKDKVEFDYGDIREKGAELITSGGKAPGPAPLRECLERLDNVLRGAIGRQLRPIEAHDIACFIADAVLAGGIRRAAMISLFSMDDDEMIDSKSGEWWAENAQRARANNSVSLLRGHVSREDFDALWKRVQASGAGEPGFYWTNNLDWGTNPCCEIALRPYQFCNLTEINTSNIISQEDFNQRARDAAVLGTLQAGYTNFHYLRPIWQRTTEEDALVGVGLTGIASNAIKELDEVEAAEVAKMANLLTANLIGVKHAARVTTIKPSGTSSLVVGSSSGIHAWHDHYYVRRMRFNNDEAILVYLKSVIPDLIEPEHFRPDSQSVVSIPQSAPHGATIRTESALDLLERTARYNVNWVGVGHRVGDNRNNVSVTVSIQDHEWEEVGEWMWNNRETYNGISVLPYDGGTYIQAPFETITKEKYEELSQFLGAVDLTKVGEVNDNTNLAAEAACAGGACEIGDFV
jgi:ribonucleoside-triphosphate reductase